MRYTVTNLKMISERRAENEKIRSLLTYVYLCVCDANVRDFACDIFG